MNLLPKIFMDGVVINSIKSAFRLYWKRWSVFLLGGQVVTFLELTFIGCAYLLLSKEQISAFSRRMLTLGEDYPTLRFSTDVFVRHPELVTLLIALIILVAFTYVRYTLLVKSQVLRYELDLIDARTLVSSFLMSSPRAAQKYGKERIISSITQDAGTPGVCVKYGLDALTAFFSMIIYLGVAVTISWQICALALALYIFPVWSSHRIYGRMIGIGETKNLTHEQTLSFMANILSSYSRIKLDGLEDTISDRAAGVLHRNFAWRIAKRQLQGQMVSFMDGFSLLGLITTLFFGVVILQIELALLMFFFILFNRMKSSIATMTNGYLSSMELIPNIRRLHSLQKTLFDGEVPVVSNFASARTGEEIKKVELKNVSFSYSKDEPILKELSLTLKAGDRVLMTGVSGQGKSTLLEVTAGMLPPTQGEVLLNDKPLNADIFRAMRHRISLISPEFFLFEDTIASNLNLGRPEELSNVLLAEAIERAKLTQLVSTLPDGADTNIGANGAALSLGERQRLILAHLYVKHPDLLLLDEATANLDPALEAEVISELQAYIPKESIVLMVAHKPPQNFQFNLHYQVKAGQLHLIKDSREPSAAAQ